MDIAYSADYRIVSADKAVIGRKYYCPVCNGKLEFVPGRRYAPYFRHGKGVPSEIKENCELYSKKFGEFNIYNQEFAERQKVRLIIEKQEREYIFKLKFPLINREDMQMQLNNLYFSYQCKEIPDFDLNTAQLLPTRKTNEYKVPLLEKYSFYASNEINEKKLGLKISGDYNPFENGPLIFKEIQGQYISVSYNKITLSGRFFIISKTPLISIHHELDLVNKVQIGTFILYEFIMPIKFTDELQRWFTVFLNYSLLPATCHLDIVSPINFKKVGTTIEITSSRSIWRLTNIGERPYEQNLIILDSFNNRRMLRVSSDKDIHINLEKHGDYLIHLDQEVTDIITVRYVPKIKFEKKCFGNVRVNDNEVLFNVKELKASQVKIYSDLDMMIFSSKEMFYEIKKDTQTSSEAPIRIDIPRLWSLTIKKPVEKNIEDVVELLFDIYEKQYLYSKIICDMNILNNLIKIVNESEFIYKEKLLLMVYKMGLRIPYPVLNLIKKKEDKK